MTEFNQENEQNIKPVVEKSRNLNLKEFLWNLHHEYLSAILRSKIYFKPNDISYWTRVSGFKKEKVINISGQIKAENIFTDNKVYSEILAFTLPDFCIFNFSYKNFEEREDLLPKEKKHYYKMDTDMICQSPNSQEPLKGVCCDVNYDREVLSLKYNDKFYTFQFNEARRVLEGI